MLVQRFGKSEANALQEEHTWVRRIGAVDGCGRRYFVAGRQRRNISATISLGRVEISSI
jgi:hypothetical protein